MKQITSLLAFGSLFLLGFGMFSLQAKPVLNQLELRISGMTCESCAAGAQFSLERLEGVASASVSYAESKGVVVYDPEKVTLEQMIQAISDTGYRASVLSEPVAYDGDLKNDGEQVVSSREPYWNMTKGYGMMRGNCRGFMAVDNW